MPFMSPVALLFALGWAQITHPRTYKAGAWGLYFEAKSHWIQAGIEPGTFQSQVTRSAI